MTIVTQLGVHCDVRNCDNCHTTATILIVTIDTQLSTSMLINCDNCHNCHHPDCDNRQLGEITGILGPVPIYAKAADSCLNSDTIKKDNDL